MEINEEITNWIALVFFGITAGLFVSIFWRILKYQRELNDRTQIIFNRLDEAQEDILTCATYLMEIKEQLKDIKLNTQDLNLRVNIAEVRLDERKHPTATDILSNRPPRLPYAGAKRGPKPGKKKPQETAS